MMLDAYSLIKKLATMALLVLLLQEHAWANKNENEIALNTLNKQIQQILQTQQVPGFAYAIVEDGKAPIVEVFGHYTFEQQKPITINTPFRVASVSKLIVGIAAMREIEQGTLSMEDRLDTLLPWLEYTNDFKDAQPILLKHLLENTSGWNETSLSERASAPSGTLSIKNALSISAKSRNARWQPGTRHAYTNTAATVVAAIIEETTGQDFYQYVQNHIFAPLGITSASYRNQQNEMPLGHQGKHSIPYRDLIMAPSGALNISISDLAKLADEFVRSQATLLSKASMTRMETSKTSNAGEFAAGYGVYNYARYYDGFRYRGHDGALPGWLAELSYSPANGTGFVVLQNSENARAFRDVVNLIHGYLSAQYPSINMSTIARQDIGESKNTALSAYYRMVNPRMQERWFLERLVTSHYLDASAIEATLSSVFPKGWKRELVYIGNGEWVNLQNEVVMKEANDPELGKVLHYGDRVFKQESVFFAWVDKLVLLLWLLLLIGFGITSIVWLIQKARGKLLAGKAHEEARRKQRKNIMFAILGSLLFIVFLALGLISPVERLGHFGLFSVGLFLSTIVLFASTFYGLFMHIKLQHTIDARVLFALGLCYLILQSCVVLYLLNFGVIGITTWL